MVKKLKVWFVDGEIETFEGVSKIHVNEGVLRLYSRNEQFEFHPLDRISGLELLWSMPICNIKKWKWIKDDNTS